MPREVYGSVFVCLCLLMINEVQARVSIGFLVTFSWNAIMICFVLIYIAVSAAAINFMDFELLVSFLATIMFDYFPLFAPM